MRSILVGILTACVLVAPVAPAQTQPQAETGELLPKHVTPNSAKAVQSGLAYLAKTQTPDGNWTNSQDGAGYPISMGALAGMAFLANGNTTSRGPYADQVRRVVHYLLGNQTASGLITGAGQEMGRPMYGHGFSMLFLASAYGMETDEKTRAAMKNAIEHAIDLTARGQDNVGGWTYIPGGGNEGSVTVTQMQGLRAAQNAGFTVPKGTIEQAVRYLERCRQPGGGIEYMFGSGSGPMLAISAAAIATLYNAGDYDSKLAEECLNFVWKRFKEDQGNWDRIGHAYYAHLYAAQAFYQAGDEYWDDYFPTVRDRFVKTQAGNGSWNGDGVGPVYGTAAALIILQLPYKFLPIYQR